MKRKFVMLPVFDKAWKAGRNTPDGPARRILAMLKVDPQLPQKLI